MIERIKKIIKGSRDANIREKEIKPLLATEKDEQKLYTLLTEYEDLGFFRIVVCEKCNTFRSDLEWREKKTTEERRQALNCKRCGSNKIMYPPEIPKRAILHLILRYVIKGY